VWIPGIPENITTILKLCISLLTRSSHHFPFQFYMLEIQTVSPIFPLFIYKCIIISGLKGTFRFIFSHTCIFGHSKVRPRNIVSLFNFRGIISGNMRLEIKFVYIIVLLQK
jgi:hypothetical protein